MEPFASPHYLDPQLQCFLEEASFRLCKWFSKAGTTGPLPAACLLPEIEPLIDGLPAQALLDDLQLIMDGAYQPSHPGALAHLDPPPLTASIVADLICAGLNNNLLAEELSPSLSKLERKICSWFAERLALPKSAGGVAASGGTLSNLMALVVARQSGGFQNDSSSVIFASIDAHVSLAKAVRVMGLREDSLQKIPTNKNGQISLDLLEKRMSSLRDQGRNCFAIVATAGTTVRGAVDPLEELSEFSKKNNIWLHVDGAIGGIFALSKTTASVVQGISNANSITLNPQKLLGIAKTSSLLLVAKSSDLVSTFATGLPYIEPAWGEVHGGELGLQGTRSAEVLKLWLGLRQLGEKGIETLLEGALQRRRYFQGKLDQSKLECLTGPLHLIACTPKDFDNCKAAEWSVMTKKILLNQDFMLSRPIHSGRYYLKVVMGNPHTRNVHLDSLASILNQSVIR